MFGERIKLMKGKAWTIAAGAALLLVLAGILGVSGTREKRSDNAPIAATVTKSSHAQELSEDFESVAKKVEPAVVNIRTEQIVHNAAAGADDPFARFFGLAPFLGQIPQDQEQKSLGSGFLIDPRGYILTNNHVVENASKIKVKLDNGSVMPARIVGSDPQTDLAVLKIEGSNLPVLKLANSEDTKVGEWVLAFGSPFGLQETMTAGIISAKGRVIGAGPYDNFLQTDAAINPGNSGGPLVNLEGEVVGINTMILSQSGGFQGVGLAIPSSLAGDICHQIISSGKVTRGWLGVQIQDMTPDLAKSFDLKNPSGVLVAEVDAGSPAAKAGIQSGDVILAFNNKTIRTAQDVSLAVADSKVGVPAKLKILRNSREMYLDVTVGERPHDIAEASNRSEPEQHGKLGIMVENLTPEMAQEMNLSTDRGVLVTEVKPGSPADDAGVRSGDVIHEIDHKSVAKVSDLTAVTRNLRAGSTVLLKVDRQGQTLFLAFELA